MATRDPAKRRKIRALEAKRDTLSEKKKDAVTQLATVRAELKSLRAQR